MKILDILIIGVLLFWLAVAIRSIKKGQCHCSGCCESCSHCCNKRR